MNIKLPAAWADAEQIQGAEPVDKATLVGVPFRILAVMFRTSARNVNMVEIDAEKVNGDTFTFIDSSSGVRAKIVEILEAKGLDSAVESGEVVSMNLVAPAGLRFSEYDAVDSDGRRVKGKTYYLTTSGVRAPRPTPTAVEAAPKARKAPARKAAGASASRSRSAGTPEATEAATEAVSA